MRSVQAYIASQSSCQMFAPPAGLTFNHFLFNGEEPLLFHCGKRKMFPLVSAAVSRVMPVERLRWLSFGHFEADECQSWPDHGRKVRTLAALKPKVLATMHGSSFSGDGAAALSALGDHYDVLLRAALADRELS